MDEVFIDIREQNEWIRKHFWGKDYASIDDMLCVIEDLEFEVEHLEDKLKDLEEDVRENYIHK